MPVFANFRIPTDGTGKIITPETIVAVPPASSVSNLPPGPTGATGPTGPIGPPGPAGHAGAAGALSTINGSKTYDPPSLATGANTTTTVTATGATMGDFALPSFSLAASGFTITALVTATDTVTVTFSNDSGNTVDLASGTLRVMVIKLVH